MKNPERVVVGPNFLEHWFVYDFQICHGQRALRTTIDYINRHGYDIVAVSQNATDYTVFFRRRACG